MIASIQYQDQLFTIDLSKPLDLSVTLKEGQDNPNCYWAEPVVFETIKNGDFVGSVAQGGSVNYKKVLFTPHGNGTHTECYGHISSDTNATLNNSLNTFFFKARLISVAPTSLSNGDTIVTKAQVQEQIKKFDFDALVLRTLPNAESKKNHRYTNTNPTYLESSIGDLLCEHNIQHLLVDLPSVDREVDQGKLSMHKAFWNLNDQVRKICTITELIFVNNNILDGAYVLELQVPNVQLDAFCSRPILYSIHN